MPRSARVFSNTSHPALSRTRTLQLLSASSDLSSLADALTSAYIHGTPASASAATDFLLQTTPPHPLSTTAPLLRGLPSASPQHALAALSRVAARAAIGHSTSALLTAFAFAGPVALSSAISSLSAELFRIPPPELRGALSEVAPFLSAVLSNPVDATALRLASILSQAARRPSRGSSGASETASSVIRILLDAGLSNPSTVESTDGTSYQSDASTAARPAFAHFTAKEIATLLPAAGTRTAASASRAGLIYALQTGDPIPLLALSSDAGARFSEALDEVGRGNLLFGLCVCASANAGLGDFYAVEVALKLALPLVSDRSAKRIESATAAFAKVVAVAVGSLTGGVGSTVERNAAVLLRELRAQGRDSDSEDVFRTSCGTSDEETSGLHLLLRDAVVLASPRASAYLGALSALRNSWTPSSPLVTTWFRDTLPDLISLLPTPATGKGNQEKALARGFVGDNEDHDAVAGNDPEFSLVSSTSWREELFPQFISLVCTTGLSHWSAGTRFAAAEALALVENSTAVFFCFPSVLGALALEKNGAVAAHILSCSLGSSSMIRDRESARSVLAMVLKLLSAARADIDKKVVHMGSGGDASSFDGQGQNVTETNRSPSSLHLAETCFRALAVAACLSPSVALPALLSEVGKVHSKFDSTDESLKCAAAAAVAHVVSKRPSRGPSFIPLIQHCIKSHAAEANPAAAALAFHAMRGMALEGVLDTAKALKIVFRNHENPLSVPSLARKSYFSLLGCAHNCATSRKGRQTASRVIGILREAVINSSPVSTSQKCLSWDEVGQAGASLSLFDVSDVLRIEFENDEEAEDAEAERERLVEIEKKVGLFVGDLARVAGASASQVDSKAHGDRRLGHLLERIAAAEWARRARGQFDPERIAKLRAASDALKRARAVKGGSGKDNLSDSVAQNEDVVAEEFLKAVEKLPDGAIKALSHIAVRILFPRAPSHEVQKATDRPSSSCFEGAAALRCLAESNALSPALSWPKLLGSVLRQASKSPQFCFSSVVRACFALPRDSFDVASLHKDLLGTSDISRYGDILDPQLFGDLAEALVAACDTEKIEFLATASLRPAVLEMAAQHCVSALHRAREPHSDMVEAVLSCLTAFVMTAISLDASKDVDTSTRLECEKFAETLSCMGACLVRTNSGPPGTSPFRLQGGPADWRPVDFVRASCYGRSGDVKLLTPIAVEVSRLPESTTHPKVYERILWHKLLTSSLVAGISSLGERDRRYVFMEVVEASHGSFSHLTLDILMSCAGVPLMNSLPAGLPSEGTLAYRTSVLFSGAAFYEWVASNDKVFCALDM